MSQKIKSSVKAKRSSPRSRGSLFIINPAWACQECTTFATMKVAKDSNSLKKLLVRHCNLPKWTLGVDTFLLCHDGHDKMRDHADNDQGKPNIY
jgi:hypothetical protein